MDLLRSRAGRDWMVEMNNSNPARGLSVQEWAEQRKWVANRVKEYQNPEYEKSKALKKAEQESKINFDRKKLAEVDYFKRLIVVKPPVMLDDIKLSEPEPAVLDDMGIFDAPERKFEPWTFKGIKWFRYRDHIWENDGGVKGDYAGRFDGEKIDASQGEPAIFK